jgi:hypothetical protein
MPFTPNPGQYMEQHLATHPQHDRENTTKRHANQIQEVGHKDKQANQNANNDTMTSTYLLPTCSK